MKLNCKPGDLAYITKHGSPNQGKFVTVIEMYDGRKSALGNFYEWIPGRRWIVKGGGLVEPVRMKAVPWHVVSDEHLRPIRPDEGDDETLIWAGKPEKVTA